MPLTKSATYAGSLRRTLLIFGHLAARAGPHARGTVIAKHLDGNSKTDNRG